MHANFAMVAVVLDSCSCRYCCYSFNFLIFNSIFIYLLLLSIDVAALFVFLLLTLLCNNLVVVVVVVVVKRRIRATQLQ